MSETYPAVEKNMIHPMVEAADGSIYVHSDLMRQVAPFELRERFGDLVSWVAYIKSYKLDTRLLTWNSSGFKAKMAYETSRNKDGSWEATYPFVSTPQWAAWQGFATGQAVPHRTAVEFLDDHLADIIDPDSATLLALLRSLRASVNTGATAELRADGTTHVSFEKTARASAGNELDLPPEFTIGVPILKGDPQPWKLTVKVRVTVGDNATLHLRFSIPQSEQVLETVYAERVAAAKEALGDGYDLLRAAD